MAASEIFVALWIASGVVAILLSALKYGFPRRLVGPAFSPWEGWVGWIASGLLLAMFLGPILLILLFRSALCRWIRRTLTPS